MTDKRVESVPLPEDDERVAQEVTGADTVLGGGEWPSPTTPPSGPSPGAGNEPSTGPPSDEGSEPLLKEMLAADPTAGGSKSAPAAEEGRSPA
ncbi:MAG TPA: hypothetical protein VNA57_11575 [Acidimicrobiales bacterium]|nr:hypothetical protein [Acidimicrobiales bacterium]